MFEKFKFHLQLFAGEGAGAGSDGGDGASSGDMAVDAGQQRLLELGVPKDKIRNRAARNATQPKESAPKAEESKSQEPVAAANDTEEEPKTEEKPDVPKKPSFKELMKDPEYESQMRAIVSARLKESQTDSENLNKILPALEVLARQYKLDPNNIDYEALSNAISGDRSLYESVALEKGSGIEQAMKEDQEERNTLRQQRKEVRDLQEQKIQDHIRSLEQQGEAMKKIYPDFNLREEMKNPAFARMTAPNVGVSVEDAYFAVHREEIQARSAQVVAQQTQQKISNAIQANSKRPIENGTSKKAASAVTFSHKNMSREQRESLKKQIYEAAANGKKLYPGQL